MQTVPPGARGGSKDGLEVIVAGTNEYRALEIGRHRLTPSYDNVTTVSEGSQHLANPPSADDHRGRHGGAHRRRGSPNPTPREQIAAGEEAGGGGRRCQGKLNSGRHLGGGEAS